MNILAAVVLVDFKRAEGFPLTSVANYVARIALAQTRLPAVPNDAPSILNLFADSANKERETDLTAWDRAYLKALYSQSHGIVPA